MIGNGATYLHSTLAYCQLCNVAELARVTAYESGVFLERMCPKQGTRRVKIANSKTWYIQRTEQQRTCHELQERKPSQKGCPFDCGPCQWHNGGLHLPVFSITNDCNLDCPICFTYNRPDSKYYKSVEETKHILNHIVAQSGGVQLINLTGGEPTLHPNLFEILETCRCEGIGRITMNTNGIKIAEDERFAEKIKASGVQLVLSLDTLDPQKSKIIHGKDITDLKRKCLERLAALDIPTTLIPVCIKGINENDVVDIVHSSIRQPFIRSITVQNMAYTGKNGSTFHPREHITMEEVEGLLAMKAGINEKDFFALSAYHPLCYSAAYYIVHDDVLLPLADLLTRELLLEMSAGAYFLRPGRNIAGEFNEGISRLWAEGADDKTIKILRTLLEKLYPGGRQLPEAEQEVILEQWVKMVLIHPHMDSDNFDIDRVSSCGDLVPDEEGRMIPACAYNLFHRQQDQRFWVSAE